MVLKNNLFFSLDLITPEVFDLKKFQNRMVQMTVSSQIKVETYQQADWRLGDKSLRDDTRIQN